MIEDRDIAKKFFVGTDARRSFLIVPGATFDADWAAVSDGMARNRRVLTIDDAVRTEAYVVGHDLEGIR